MKLNSIRARGFIGARDVEIQAAAPIVVVAGDNEAGKSSVYEAITLAATGDMARVKLKNEYKEVVTDGATSGQVLVEFSEGNTASFEVPTGKWAEAKGLTAPAVRFCLNAHRFAALDETERRRFLFGLTDTRLSKEIIGRRMKQRGIADDVIAAALPLTERGLDVASKQCADNAKERKGQWREVTAETWGAQKGGTWHTDVPGFDEAAHQAALADLATQRNAKDKARTDLGVLRGRAEAAQRDSARIDTLRAKLAKKDALEVERSRLDDEIAFDVDELKAATEALNVIAAPPAVATAPKGNRKGAQKPAAPEPPAMLLDAVTPLRGLLEAMATHPQGLASRDNGGPLEAFGWDTFDFSDQAGAVVRSFDATYPDYAPGCAELEPTEVPVAEQAEVDAAATELAKTRAAAADRVARLDGKITKSQQRLTAIAGDLGAMEAWQSQLTELETRGGTDGDAGAIDTAQIALDRLDSDVKEAEERIRELEVLRAASTGAVAKNKRAAALHLEIVAWDACAKALAPDGIPAEIVADALDPLNHELGVIAEQSGWPAVSIDAGMVIRYGGRRYELLAESGQWRADAMIAAMIAAISGIRFVMLDRIDVNSIQNRQKLLRWLGVAVRSKRLDGAFLLGTLKAPPSGLPPELFATAWLERGTTVVAPTAQ